MKIELNIRNTDNTGELSPTQLDDIQEIFTALVSSGGLTGVKGGQTIIHFDGNGLFQKVELKYVPWIRRKN